MKRLIIGFLAYGFLVAGQASSPVQMAVDTSHWYMKHSYDVIQYRLTFDLYSNYTNPFPKSYQATEEIFFRVDTALNQIKLDARENSLQIDSVKLAGTSFTHENDTLYVYLDRMYLPGETAAVRICFQHKNVSDQGFYATGGYVFTDFPPEGARRVFPCWDRPSDKATTDITCKVPLSVRLGSTGGLADSTILADTIWYHWVSAHPVSTYLVTLTSKVGFNISIPYWHQLNNPDDSIPVRLYYKQGESITNVSELIAPLTDFYSEKFGEYPFEKIGFATLSSAFPWGGMENQTMVNLMPGGYNDDGLLAHEHSHQWFGDMITCGTWADIWLNEGFGTYCDALWTENATGYTAYKTRMNNLANYYLGHNPGIPIYNPMWAIQTPSSGLLYHTGLTYDKGACVLHQLRYVLGDSIFFSVLNAYASDTNLRFKNAVTEDFIAIVNQVSGDELGWFFDEWVYAPDHPKYDNTYEFNDLGNDQWNVKLIINQIQTNTFFFRMPVEIGIGFSDLTDTLLTVWNDSNNQVFEFIFHKEPTSLEFDPNRNILLKQATTVVSAHPAGKNCDNLRMHIEPNPFQGTTKVTYTLGKAINARLTILDLYGQNLMDIVNHFHAPGEYSLILRDDLLAPGLYFLWLEAGSYSELRKVVVIK